jgi:hypothetical protein
MTLLRALSLCPSDRLMTLTGLGAAMARGQMAADGVICGTGTYAVILAADGLPLFDAGGARSRQRRCHASTASSAQIALVPASTGPARGHVTASRLADHSPASLPQPLAHGWHGTQPARRGLTTLRHPKTSQDRWRETCP